MKNNLPYQKVLYGYGTWGSVTGSNKDLNEIDSSNRLITTRIK